AAVQRDSVVRRALGEHAQDQQLAPGESVRDFAGGTSRRRRRGIDRPAVGGDAPGFVDAMLLARVIRRVRRRLPQATIAMQDGLAAGDQLQRLEQLLGGNILTEKAASPGPERRGDVAW